MIESATCRRPSRWNGASLSRVWTATGPPLACSASNRRRLTDESVCPTLICKDLCSCEAGWQPAAESYSACRSCQGSVFAPRLGATVGKKVAPKISGPELGISGPALRELAVGGDSPPGMLSVLFRY